MTKQIDDVERSARKTLKLCKKAPKNSLQKLKRKIVNQEDVQELVEEGRMSRERAEQIMMSVAEGRVYGS